VKYFYLPAETASTTHDFIMKTRNCLKILIASALLIVIISPSQGDSGNLKKRILVIKSRDSAFYTPTYAGFVLGLQSRGRLTANASGLTVIVLTGNSSADDKLVKSEVSKDNELIFALGTDATIAVENEHTTTPCLFTMLVDPVSLGLVKSLAQPGGNFTGTSLLVDPGKQLDTLRQVAGDVKRIGVLYTDGDATSLAFLALARQEAQGLGIEIVATPISDYSSTGRESLERLATKVDAFWLIVDPASAGPQPLADTLEIAKKNKLPVLGMSSANVRSGALLSLSADLHDLGDVDAEMACPIIDGSMKPASMPVRGPRQTILSINLNTARDLGKSIPDSVLHLADEVIDGQQSPSGN
jgi:putative ABC transport system substrate-binding protein